MKEFRGLLAPAQTIKTWYRLMPGMLGKKLARRKELGGVLRKNEGFSEAFQGFRGLIIAQGCQKRVHAADLSHRVTGAQTIKTWYKHMPDMLGKKAGAAQGAGGRPVRGEAAAPGAGDRGEPSQELLPPCMRWILP